MPIPKIVADYINNNNTLCSFGCGHIAKYQYFSGKYCCSPAPNSCEGVKKKNSRGVKIAHDLGLLPGWIKLRQQYPDKFVSWNKGVITATFEYNGKGNHKGFLLRERGYKCQDCQITEWNSKAIILELHHIDGDTKNNTRENLLLLCPNCHSQTGTWRKSKRDFLKEADEAIRKNPGILEAVKTSFTIAEVLEKVGLENCSSNYTVIQRILQVKKITLAINSSTDRTKVSEKNSQFGTMWITSLDQRINKKIKKEEFVQYEKEGFVKGRVLLFEK